MDNPKQPSKLIEHHPPGFRLRRVRNWFFLGLTYAAYYLCRLNLTIVAPELKATLDLTNERYGAIDAARNWAYALGQFINGLFTDRLGGKQAMTIGAVGTVVLNLAFGIAAWSDIKWIFMVLLIIRLLDGYVQAFGAPGMIKINTAWFLRKERGTFAGIFGFMINLGATGAGYLGKVLTTGLAVPLLFFTLKIPALDWRYIFIVPPVFVAIIVVLMNVMVCNHPEEAGYRIKHDDESHDDDPHENLHLGHVFRTVAGNPVVWIVAGAYFCTGFVRTAIWSWWVIYFHEVWNIGKDTALFYWMSVILLPFMASAGSLASGVISDKLFGGRRAPVAALLYLFQAVCISIAILMSQGAIGISAVWIAAVIVAIFTGCNATHSLLGTAAAMDLGGRKMAGFASGVIDSFQYIGAGMAGLGLGRLLDAYAVPVADTATPATTQPVMIIDPTVWFASMLPWGVVGTALMGYLWIRHRGTDERGT